MTGKHFIKLGVVFFLLLSKFSFAQCGLYEIALQEKIANSKFIIEGEVIAQNCYKSIKVNKVRSTCARTGIKINLFGILAPNLFVISS